MNMIAYYSSSELLSSSEYEIWYAYGRLPERLHSAKAAELTSKYLAGDLSVAEFEEELDIAMGVLPDG